MGKAQNGRVMRFELPDPDGDGSTYIPVAGAREDTMTLENGEVDVSDKDSEYRQLLEGGTRSFNGSFSGVYESDDPGAAELVDRAINNRIGPVRLVYKDGEMFEGPMQVGSYERTGTNTEGVTFSCEVKSAGEYDYTAPTPA